MSKFDYSEFETQRKKISGKWKPVIMCLMQSRQLKFNKIKQLLPLISSRMLSQCLKEMEIHGLITKHEISHYKLSELGSEICGILIHLNEKIRKLPN